MYDLDGSRDAVLTCMGMQASDTQSTDRQQARGLTASPSCREASSGQAAAAEDEARAEGVLHRCTTA